jgi:O-antigen/teichoic acid export membrane protein
MKKELQQFTYVAIPKALGGVALILVNILLLRQLNPEQFGIYSLCVAMILAVDSVMGSAFDLGVLRLTPVLRVKEPRYSFALEKSAIFLKFIFSFTAVIFASIFASQLGELLFHTPDTESLIYITAGATISMLMLRSALAHQQINESFSRYGLLDMLHLGVKYGGISLLVALGGASVFTVMVFFALGPAISFVLFVWQSRNSVFAAAKMGLRAAKELLGYVKWYLLTYLLGVLLSRADIFLLTTLSEVAEVGIFSGGYVYAIIPELLGTYLAVVFTPKVMPYCEEKRFYPYFIKVQSSLLLLALLIYISAYPIITLLGDFLLPPSFNASAEILMVLLIGTLASMITFPLTLSFVMFIRPKFILYMDLVALPITLGLYFYFISKHGAIGAAWVTAITRLIKAGIVQVVAWRWAKTN